MRRLLLVALLALSPTLALAKAPVFYVCAHPDDCILFMNPNLYNDISQREQETVIVYLTSGDAGQPFRKDTKSYPRIRERASLDATSWAESVDLEGGHARTKSEMVVVDGHAVERVIYGSTTTYFLRLPDGNMYGDGYPQNSLQSLKKFKAGEIPHIRSIDGRTTYTNWDDLVSVLEGIVTNEAPNEKNITVHLQDPDVTRNTTDHTDHTVTGLAVMDMMTRTSEERCYTVFKHIDYSIADREANLGPDAVMQKAASFAVLTATQHRFGDIHNWDKAHRGYIQRNYFTTESLPAGCTATQ